MRIQFEIYISVKFDLKFNILIIYKSFKKAIKNLSRNKFDLMTLESYYVAEIRLYIGKLYIKLKLRTSASLVSQDAKQRLGPKSADQTLKG